jgi:hypothetical protein
MTITDMVENENLNTKDLHKNQICDTFLPVFSDRGISYVEFVIML